MSATDERGLVFKVIVIGDATVGNLRANFYQGSSAAIIVFSQENTERGIKSIDHINKWYENIKKRCGSIPIILFGNKSDLIDTNTLERNKKRAETIMNQYRFLSYYPTSALTGDGVISAFDTLVIKLIELYKSFA